MRPTLVVLGILLIGSGVAAAVLLWPSGPDVTRILAASRQACLAGVAAAPDLSPQARGFAEVACVCEETVLRDAWPREGELQDAFARAGVSSLNDSRGLTPVVEAAFGSTDAFALKVRDCARAQGGD